VKRHALLATLIVGGCSDSNVDLAGSPFDPVQFFTGRSHGDATLQTIVGRPSTVSVDSLGTPDGRGGIVLQQTVRQQGKAARVRKWTLTPRGPSRWSGTLSDAAGPVVVERTASDVAIRYRMKNGARVEQHLKLQPGGVAQNHMTVSRFGLTLATLDERIRKAAK